MGERMIAYNHYIKFIPELKNDKKDEGSFSNTITIEESFYKHWKENLKYKWTFFNNQGRDIDLYTDRELSRTVQGQSWAFNVEGVITFFWKSRSSTINYIAQKGFTSQLLEYWSLHTLLPIFFTVEEKFDFLHAGAVEVECKPILFVAESFGGKSTMTDFFIKKNHPMISDDKVAILKKDGAYYAVPSHPHHRPYRKAEDLGFYVANMVTYPKPIHAIYELDATDANADITISEIHGIEKFKILRLSSQINLEFLRTQRFVLLGDIARLIPIYQVTVPWDLNRLNEVHDVICQHCKEIE